MSRRIFPTWTTISMALLAASAALVPLAGDAEAQEPAACLLDNPNSWPASSKPYFMVLIDSSGSMISAVNQLNSCAYQDNQPAPGQSTRMAHAKCAVTNTVLAYSGQVNFGLSQFAMLMTGCGAGCYGDADGNPPACSLSCYTAELNMGLGCAGCGPRPGDYTTRRGARVLVPVQQDNNWTAPPTASNVDPILDFIDNDCSSNVEVYNPPDDGPAFGRTPLSGSLRDMLRYFQTGWTNPDNAAETYPTPLSTNDRPCRSVNVILLTDGDETCDSTTAGVPDATGQARAVEAVRNLYNTGATIGANTFRIRTHVINFAGGSVANTNQLADAGDDGTLNNSALSYLANNEDDVAVALSEIISSTVAPEVCDNSDNNCNGCTDEGYRHYCNTQQDCCSLARAQCLEDYEDSITAQDPDGDLTLLPCANPPAQTQPANWLCFNPGDECDNIDNNCSAGTDEGVVRCGSPLHCPLAETCNGEDDDCDGVIDNGVCSGCSPTPEICDGCDNDCDGIVDNGVGPVACGPSSPPSCLGTRSCTTAQASVPAGQCSGAPTFGQCSTAGGTETCNNIDDDCDGVIDDGVAPQVCVPNGTPGNLVYGGLSQCRQGSRACQSGGGFGPCIGFIGPSTEICDGVDNDCDGQVDAADPDLVGAGEECGISGGQCTPGVTACVASALSCVGAVGGQPEVCNGLDDDCDGSTDEAPLSDAPAAGETGCWNLPGNCCTHENFSWCAPAGADCFTVDQLDPPCAAGTLACSGANGWICQNDVGPAPEACDGVDNDCNGAIDDDDFPSEGEACGDADLPCVQGQVVCQNGFLDCVGGVGPAEEVCDGVDNDCDTEIDEGIIVGVACVVEYDTEDFPGDRTGSPCQPGVLECDGLGGSICVGGVGPSPEICDGVDNDCDGDVDETGDAPDGIDDSENPFPPPDAAIGEACGENQGICAEGAWGCLNGRFECLGGQGPQVEVCDCEDNDCNGVNDNPNENDTPRLCGEGKDCVKAGESCQCAAPCGNGEFPCPAGQECVEVVSSETGEPLGGSYCVADNCPGGCADKTVRDADDNVLCAPAGTSLPECRDVPVCECKGQSGCQPPCFGVECTAPLTCASFGDAAGTCAPNNCFSVGCPGCDTYCSGTGDCIDNPCAEEGACRPNEVCEPDGEGVTCKGSCAGVDCEAGSVCKGGTCVADCSPACEDGQVCDYGRDPAACVENQCDEDACPNGGCCDPLTGACGACACEGVVCPESQVCVDDECVEATDPTGTGGSTSSTASAGGNDTVAASGTTAGAGGSGNGSGNGPGGVFGLATGGGGCQCDVGARSDGDAGKLAVLAALGLVIGVRRRRRAQDAGSRTTDGGAAREEVSR